MVSKGNVIQSELRAVCKHAEVFLSPNVIKGVLSDTTKGFIFFNSANSDDYLHIVNYLERKGYARTQVMEANPYDGCEDVEAEAVWYSTEAYQVCKDKGLSIEKYNRCFEFYITEEKGTDYELVVDTGTNTWDVLVSKDTDRGVGMDKWEGLKGQIENKIKSAKGIKKRDYKQAEVLEDVLNLMSGIENSEKAEMSEVMELQRETNELTHAVVAYYQIGLDKEINEYMNKMAVVVAKSKKLKEKTQSATVVSGINTLLGLTNTVLSAIEFSVSDFQELADKKYEEMYGESVKASILATHLVELSAHARMLAAHGNDEESKTGNAVKELASELAAVNGIPPEEFKDLAVKRYLDYNEKYWGRV
ncbi:hypothetical protein [Bacillus sp. NEAU-Y102]